MPQDASPPAAAAANAERETQHPNAAWLPLTPRSVAAFARAPLSRLLLTQLAFAALAAGALVWCLATAWCPTVRAAIAQLPDHGAIRGGTLDLPPSAAGTLAEGRWLAFVVAAEERRAAIPVADVRVELHRKHFAVCSLLGCLAFDYPAGWTAALNRRELEPWWGAWQPTLLAAVGLSVVVGLLLVWALLAAVTCGVARVVAFYANRELSGAGSWRLAGAALMPGALLLSAGIVGYGGGGLDVVRFAGVAALHFVVGWGFLLAAPFFLPRAAPAAPRVANPFAVPAAEAHHPPAPKP
jgi:hypothetical protein